MFTLFGLGALAAWADSEPVLPAYFLGMVLAGTVGKDHALIRRLRTLTFGLLTPFYFIRAGSLVSLPALAARRRPFRSVGGQACDQDHRRLPGHAGLPFAAARGHVYDLADVDRPHLRHDFGFVRAFTSDHQPSAIFHAGRGRHRERRRADLDRQRRFPASLFVAQAAGRGGDVSDASRERKLDLKRIPVGYVAPRRPFKTSAPPWIQASRPPSTWQASAKPAARAASTAIADRSP